IARLYSPVVQDPVFGYQGVNVEAQLRTPTSFLNWIKRMIGVRKRHPAFGRGSLEFLHPENQKVLAYVREYEGETILAVLNLSRFVQYAEMDLSKYQGRTPVELIGRTPFPTIGELPYFFTLGPHGFYWFKLEPPASS
ncbi:MAG: alpha-glucosidase C-terminal domain-containing protein, partial [Dehalococcoidales bacterium]|nr:alpha-glucosidase C-terminal domain-containing protein [Dehalococcoidales bacterium]